MDFSLEFPQISRRLLHEIVTEKLRYNKVCARWVPKLLTEGHKKQPKAASLTFLEAYEKDGDSLLHPVVTGDETCVKHMTCETKHQSMEWEHTSSPKDQGNVCKLCQQERSWRPFLGQGGCASGGFP